MKRLEDKFDVLYPLFVHQMELIQLKPDGKNPRMFLQHINRVSLEAGFDNLDRQLYCVLHLAKTIEDDRLRDKIFQLGKPMYDDVMKLVTSYVSNQ